LIYSPVFGQRYNRPSGGSFPSPPGEAPPGGCQKSIKNRPTTTIISQTTASTNFKIFFIILILQMDYGIFLGEEVSLPDF